MVRWIACWLVAGSLASAGHARGPEDQIGPSSPGASPAGSRQPDKNVAPIAALSDGDLGANRAGQATVTGSQTLKAVTTGNSVNGNIVAGAITLSGNALSKFSGVGNFAINSGSQVSIQSGMNLTINVTN